MEEVHVAILAVTALAILVADHYGVSYMRGAHATLPKKRVEILHWLVYGGLLGMVATGVYMVAPAWQYYLSDTVFQLKMAFVAVLLVNSFFISILMKYSFTTPFAELSNGQKLLLLLSGGASAMGWIGAAVIGFFFL